MLRGSGLTLSNGDGTSRSNNSGIEIYDEDSITQDLIFPKSQLRPPSAALPGRPRRRGTNIGSSTSNERSDNANNLTTAAPRRRRKRRPASGKSSSLKNQNFFSFFFSSNKNKRDKSNKVASALSIPLAVALWYGLGVVSIGTSKLLLTPDGDIGIRPFMLSVQQFALGALLLRVLLWYSCTTVIPIPTNNSVLGERNTVVTEIFLSGLFFASGFVATNFCFRGSAASFVETVKAAEPITSAGIAVFNGIEILSYQEVLSLLAIVSGVLISTLGHSPGQHSNMMLSSHSSQDSPLVSSLQSSVVVMLSNFCFSFRGLHQKILRSSHHGSKDEIDDVNLQYRMQQIGVLVFIIPAAVFEFPSAVRSVWILMDGIGLFQSGIFFRYTFLSLINGFAFAGYNLSSTYILSRISIVHHAALNCIRRVFAIIVTSFAFQVPLTMIGVIGIVISFFGFMSFTRYKMKRKMEHRPLSSLLPVSAV